MVRPDNETVCVDKTSFYCRILYGIIIEKIYVWEYGAIITSP